MYNKIKEKETSFDVILMSGAAFGHILTHKCHSELKKDIVYLGGSIQEMFGIASKREKRQDLLRPMNIGLRKYQMSIFQKIVFHLKADVFGKIQMLIFIQLSGNKSLTLLFEPFHILG